MQDTEIDAAMPKKIYRNHRQRSGFNLRAKRRFSCRRTARGDKSSSFVRNQNDGSF